MWHRDTLNAALTEHAGIRQAFPALLTAGDVLARIEQMTANQALPGFIDPEQFAGVLIDHAHTTLDSQRWVRFDEAGDDTEKQSVEQVIVNLPARDENGVAPTSCGRAWAAATTFCGERCGRPMLLVRHRRRGIWSSPAPRQREEHAGPIPHSGLPREVRRG